MAREVCSLVLLPVCYHKCKHFLEDEINYDFVQPFVFFISVLGLWPQFVGVMRGKALVLVMEETSSVLVSNLYLIFTGAA